MYEISTSSRFKKDFKRLARSGRFDIEHFHKIVNHLAANKKLSAKYRDHQLKGDHKKFRECHLEPDLLLIYSKDEKVLTLLLFRMGSDSEMFGK